MRDTTNRPQDDRRAADRPNDDAGIDAAGQPTAQSELEDRALGEVSGGLMMPFEPEIHD